MKAEQVESICSHLSQLLKNTIRSKVLNIKELPATYTAAEALFFWTADTLLGTKLITGEQIRLILEEFKPRLWLFGSALKGALQDKAHILTPEQKSKLPLCKVGILDRKFVCLDGTDFFIDLQTGQSVKAVNRLPLETIAYNLTVVFLNYRIRRWKLENSNGNDSTEVRNR